MEGHLGLLRVKYAPHSSSYSPQHSGNEFENSPSLPLIRTWKRLLMNSGTSVWAARWLTAGRNGDDCNRLHNLGALRLIADCPRRGFAVRHTFPAGAANGWAARIVLALIPGLNTSRFSFDAENPSGQTLGRFGAQSTKATFKLTMRAANSSSAMSRNRIDVSALGGPVILAK